MRPYQFKNRRQLFGSLLTVLTNTPALQDSLAIRELGADPKSDIMSEPLSDWRVAGRAMVEPKSLFKTRTY
jgi:hypothetical protein